MEIITDILELGARSEEIDPLKEGDLVRQTNLSLKEIIREKNLKGLSAPQIGVQKRIIVINFNGTLRCFVNPIITRARGLELSRENCSSLPGREFIRPRNNDITITYQTPIGKIESRQLLGLAAIVFQHELDHLDGLLLTDIGLEIDDRWDAATEEERAEVINAYLDSLDLRQKDLEKEIQENPELKQMDDAIKFMDALQKGEVELEQVEDNPNTKEEN